MRFLISNPVYGDNDMLATVFMVSLLIILVMMMAKIGFHENPSFAEQQTFIKVKHMQTHGHGADSIYFIKYIIFL